jgi:spermidine synthase
MPVTSLPGGLTLRTRGARTEILAGGVVLLSDAALATERALGRLVTTLAPRADARVLIGGLGFGATLRGVLDAASPGARVVVAEKLESVVALVAGDLAHVEGRPLADARAAVLCADVFDVMTRDAAAWDAILLDVDNGPHWASFRSNARLYTAAGLAAARRALAPGGSLALWSGYPANAFLPRLREAGFAPRCIPLLERGRVRARAYVGTLAG